MKILLSFIKFLLGLYRNRGFIWTLTKRDFKSRYLGSCLGLLWAFIHPIVLIFIFWFVFEMGFKVKTTDAGCPFLLWFITGVVPWFFFSEAITAATNSVLEHGYLVKKVVFQVSALPIVKIGSALLIHLIFILIIAILFTVYGYKPNLCNLQVFYYLFCALVLLLGLSWLTSSVLLFFRDLSQIVLVCVQMGFWVTPIFWNIRTIPEKYRILMKLNPVYYITEGYRNSFVYHCWFWEHWRLTIYFWSVTLFIFVLGAFVFSRLRRHFADIL